MCFRGAGGLQYRFDGFTLDYKRGELRDGEQGVEIEPRAFAVLCYFVENQGLLISKDELIEKIWDGRFISDAAVSTAIKSVRKAFGDDGTNQKYIRTVHGRGFRFVGDVQIAVANPSVPASVLIEESTPTEAQDRRGEQPSIAVLPFGYLSSDEKFASIADAIPGEIISTLSRLRWLKVISRGSSFRFRTAVQDYSVLRQALGASYILTGDVELLGGQLGLSVDLVDSRSGQVVWSDRRTGPIEDLHAVRDELVILVASAMELHIPQHEAALARLRNPDSLDAWSFYHTGLQHMFRFNKTDNALAEGYLKRATELDPNFARAFAARSFTSFQAAFLRYHDDRSMAIDAAQRFAEKSLELDPMDPFGNFNFGRSHWLRLDPAAGQTWIERSINLSPSFAQGYYAHGWADVMAGDGASALVNVEQAISLSPLDPFLYAMQSCKGMANMQVGKMAEAQNWAVLGAQQPGAHYLIKAIAAAISHMNGDAAAARRWYEYSLQMNPNATVRSFFVAFPFADEGVRSQFHRALLALGYPETD